MTAEVRNKNSARSPWFIRKYGYYLVGGVLGIFALIGWVSREQVEAVMDLLERAMPTIGSLALLLAGNKTTRGSDEKVTEQDVRDAAAAAGATAAASVHREAMEEIRRRLDSLSSSAWASAPAGGGDVVSGGGTYPAGS